MDQGMETTRLEAFSDGVIAVIITIMVLELKLPEPPNLSGLLAEWPIFVAYAVSFVLVATYWVNHHHLMHAAKRVSGPTLWRNIHWLFWLSLYPFITHFVSASRGAPTSLAVYGGLGAITAGVWAVLIRDLRRRNLDVAALVAIGPRRDAMILASIGLNIAAIPLAFFSRPLAVLCLVLPPLAYFMPARSLEKFAT